ncbi:sulfite exporter TauE/SafE family protein [Streptomyces marispadix]|uniref:Probable membrane transporter protein n=1 Tax=Streptomyces marispadix TaxID=2922868 RepID=A0ABS9T3M8_9ACTN|nr:sulfite exporter TauE/SafE family protein [Streptomyces marispadix]MCH6163154.1 sulfite exporter TauE/SafE family protein [Streptomyces marispadix]
MEFDPLILALLALFGLAGGIGITAVGPGGVLPTIGMFLLTGLSPSGVAGTAIATHIATGALGTAAYTRSGQLRDPRTRRIALVLSTAALVGSPLGVFFNTLADGRVFAILLAIAVATTGILVWLRERRTAGTADAARAADSGGGPTSSDPGTGSGAGSGTGPASLSPVTTAALGLLVAVAAGLFGLGGPMLSVPLLVIAGLPLLPALAAAQAQSVVIASVGTVAYLVHGSVDWALAVLVGVPELAGVMIGWKIAHAVPTRKLKYALAGTLLALAPYLALHG